MLHGQQSAVHQPSAADQKSSRASALSIAVSPLAMPILAGPGTIATAMNFAGAGGISDVIVAIVAFATLCVITYLFFVSGERLLGILGDNGLNVVTRLMGLILAVIGVQMLITGLAGAVKANLS
jgi:multiple antibiotic resistance protein